MDTYLTLRPLLVDAVQSVESKTITTDLGFINVRQGEWVICGEGGECYIVDDAFFRRTFVSVNDACIRESGRQKCRISFTPVIGTAERFAVGEIMLDPVRYRVEKAGSRVSLTPTEFRALQLLMQQPGIPISHSTLIAALWGRESRAKRQHLRVVIGALRKKLEDNPSEPRYLTTTAHFGYCFSDR